MLESIVLARQKLPKGNVSSSTRYRRFVHSGWEMMQSTETRKESDNVEQRGVREDYRRPDGVSAMD
jgi:hypothetical protein